MREWLGLVARLVTGGVWIWAGALKLGDSYQSVQAVRAYELLPESLVEPVGYLLPVLEVVVGFALVVGVLTRGAAVLSALLFVVFIIGIASAWARGLQIDCGCFGGGGYDPGAESAYPWEIARDAALLLASLFLVRWPRTRLSLDSVLFRPTTA
ncbi:MULTISPECIES: MauE/DoxX family redox-associated membrane protein [unclassified Nocardioides]|uniref:MauE/DoxX family redox-associated membrane protein n=1 Tax=unclassified Nocardioides TaxID=2615069 RepID=UPI0030157C93